MIIVLENIRSGWNVGSIFRTCDAVGSDLILVGYTPRPNPKTDKVIHKTAIGAENSVKWEYFSHSQEVFQKYNDFKHFAIDINTISENLFDFLDENKDLDLTKTILWFGNEIRGLSEETMTTCEKTLHLPMKGFKESLNIATSVSAATYLFLYKNLK
jgi:23S rRNA (guanosine2251-2'-O)-methyltransferase